MLNIIGDSHVNTFSGAPNTRIWEIDPELSIKTLKDHYSSILSALHSRPMEVWAFQIGERDVRKYILPNSVSTHRPIINSIQDFGWHYLRFILRLNSVYDIYVMSTPPQGIVDDENEEFFTPREVRHINSVRMNSFLKVSCESVNIKFLELWKMGAYPKDMLGKNYLQADGIHVKPALAETALKHALKNRHYTPNLYIEKDNL